MYTVQQLQHNAWYQVGASPGLEHKAGERLTIVNRRLYNLKFFLYKTGVESAGGADCFFRIYRSSDNILLASVDLGQWNNLPGSPGDWVTGTFSSPVDINDDVRICFYSTWSIVNQSYPSIAYTTTTVKPSEEFTRGNTGGSGDPNDETWGDVTAYQCAYQYDYVALPSIQTRLPAPVASRSATMNGLLSDDGGEPSNCGFQWGLK